jgi:glycosyltransferase involved in cell wall biosynthesis
VLTFEYLLFAAAILAMKKPLVSVIIPVYNRGRQIAATLDSVLQQTLSPLEVIVVDDGSVDESATWIEAHYGARVQVIRQPNGGVARARNRGLQQARGEFIAFLDHDDIWHPNKLERQLETLRARPECGVAYSLWQQIGVDGEAAPGHDLLMQDENWMLPEGRLFAGLLRHNFLISMSVPLVRTALAREVGGFDPQTVPCDDYDFWLQLSRRTQFALVREVLVFYNHHENQQSRDQLKMWHGKRRAQLKHWRAISYRPKVLWFIVAYGYFLRTAEPFYGRARGAIAQSNWPEAKRQIVKCSLRHPLTLFTPQWLYVVKRLVTKNARPF